MKKISRLYKVKINGVCFPYLVPIEVHRNRVTYCMYNGFKLANPFV